eukprot:2967426-Amphidinium_carterae.1
MTGPAYIPTLAPQHASRLLKKFDRRKADYDDERERTLFQQLHERVAWKYTVEGLQEIYDDFKISKDNGRRDENKHNNKN